MPKCVLDHILVKPDPIEGGPEKIQLLDETREKMERETMSGTVMVCGPGRPNEAGGVSKLSVKVGDHILFDFNSGIVVYVDGKIHRVMREPDVLVITNR
jgi:co-chaperonin GroES (HSP10)